MFKYFIKKHIMDIGGMENEEEIEVLDGSSTCVDNQLLFDVITGNWSDTDDYWHLTISGEAYDSHISLELDSEKVLESTMRFTYVLPNPFPNTELIIDTNECRNKNAVVFAKIYSLVHEADDGSGKLLMEIIEGNSSKIVEFYKCESVH